MKIIPVFIVAILVMAAIQVSNISLQVNGLNCMMCSNPVYTTSDTPGLAAGKVTGVTPCNFNIIVYTNNRFNFSKVKVAMNEAGLLVSGIVTTFGRIDAQVRPYQTKITGSFFQVLNRTKFSSDKTKAHGAYNHFAGSNKSWKNSFSIYSPGTHFITIK